MAKKAAKSAKGGGAKIAKTSKRGKVRIAASDVFKHLELKHIRLIALSAKLEIKGGKVPDKSQIAVTVNVGPGPDGQHVHVNAIVDIEGRPSEAVEKSEDTSQVTIQIHYQTVYKAIEAELDALADHGPAITVSGAMQMWPHIRELAQAITGRMSIPPIVLPMFLAGSPGKSGNVALDLSRSDLA